MGSMYYELRAKNPMLTRYLISLKKKRQVIYEELLALDRRIMEIDWELCEL